MRQSSTHGLRSCVIMLCGVLSGACAVRAQDRASPDNEADTQLERLIETDRNSFTFTPLTVDPGRYINEVSYTYIDIRDALPKHSFPEFITRVGVSRRLELRFG